jgi:hypothetical protein
MWHHPLSLAGIPEPDGARYAWRGGIITAATGVRAFRSNANGTDTAGSEWPSWGKPRGVIRAVLRAIAGAGRGRLCLGGLSAAAEAGLGERLHEAVVVGDPGVS